MLSARQLQGPKSNILVHFHLVYKQLTGISLTNLKYSIKHVTHLEAKDDQNFFLKKKIKIIDNELRIMK